MLRARGRTGPESLRPSAFLSIRVFVIAVDPSSCSRSGRRTPGRPEPTPRRAPRTSPRSALRGVCLGSAHEALDLREGLLNGVEVRRVGRQVDELATSVLNELSHPLSFVG